ncbi:MAG TPA: hypothetical protein VG051_01795 [Candidatus Acidoferrum sp.]|jgi:hypothetical protein|nr:hypothetical protein [Candidatus Acidoferrum sp.]
MAIKSLKPNASRDDAIRAFSSCGFANRFWQMRNGPLRRIAEAYVPCRLYQTRYELEGTIQSRWFALDAVDGSLDLLEFPRRPGPQNYLSIETRNFLEPFLTEARAEELLRGKVLRLIFQQGFFKLRGRGLAVVREPVELHLPYWLGFHEKQRAIRCRVMDAVRRRIEGAKASAFFEEWLAA